MINIRRFSFSLATLLLVTVIVALTVSHFVQERRVKAIQAELDHYYALYGHINIEDPTLIYLSKITGRDDQSYRLYIPSGHHYMLHITDMVMPENGPPNEIVPTTTLSMNSWKKGAEVLLSWKVQINDDESPQIIVESDREKLFNYRFKKWQKRIILPGGKYHPDTGSQVEATPQKSFKPDETIRFMWFYHGDSKRGGVLWMEPKEKWESRQKAKQEEKVKRANEKADPNKS